MYFQNTEMHMVTFIITVFELVMLIFQVIYFLQRPKDTRRLMYLILLLFLILYNGFSGIFPDEDIPISFKTQNIVAYLVGFTMSMYVCYYFYKAFELEHLKFFATWGLVVFLLFPYIAVFAIPYWRTGDLDWSRKHVVIVPFIYGIAFIFWTARALIKKFQEHRKRGTVMEDALFDHAVAAFVSMLCWATLPVIVYFGDYQVLEHSVTNAGFLLMTLIYVRASVRQARDEYRELVNAKEELEHMNADLQRQVELRTESLKKVLQERTDTFINIAHETKTPLTLINNYLDEYEAKYGLSREFEIIKANVGQLNADIANLFSMEFETGFARYENNQITNFCDVLKPKLELFRSLGEKKGLSFHHEVESDVPVRAHPGALERIVNNIIDNAIKFTEPGGNIEVRLMRQGDVVVFQVEDDGPGIPCDRVADVLAPYTKLSPEKNTEGLGLGLSIVHKIVQELGGSMEITGKEGRGTTFQVSLPLAEQLQTETTYDGSRGKRDASLTDITGDKSKPHLLIVEDNVLLLESLRSTLGRDYNVYLAQSGEEALGKMQEVTSLDLVVADIMMPGLDGYDLIQRLQGTERYAHIPVIFLTARVGEESKTKAFEMGVVDYIEKPFKMSMLQAKIKALLNNLKRQRAALINHVYHELLNSKTVERDESAVMERFNFTRREQEIISLLRQGLPYKEIGDRLHISEKTVSKHIANMFGKAGVSNKTELVHKIWSD